MSDEKLRSNEVIPGAERCPHDYGRSENGHFDECHTCCKRELARLRARVEWLTNRFEDVVEDADLLLKSAPEALHPAILGIRTVADNQLGERSFDAKPEDLDHGCIECGDKPPTYRCIPCHDKAQHEIADLARGMRGYEHSKGCLNELGCVANGCKMLEPPCVFDGCTLEHAGEYALCPDHLHALMDLMSPVARVKVTDNELRAMSPEQKREALGKLANAANARRSKATPKREAITPYCRNHTDYDSGCGPCRLARERFRKASPRYSDWVEEAMRPADDSVERIIADVDGWLDVQGPVTPTHLASVADRLRALRRPDATPPLDWEQLNVQLAGCGVAALGGIEPRTQVAKRGDYGWSQSYQDVLDLRLKYEALLKEVETLRSDKATPDGPIEERNANLTTALKYACAKLDLYGQSEVAENAWRIGTGEALSRDNDKAKQPYDATAPERVELWDAIHAYARASYSGSERPPNGARMEAVSRVTRAVEDGMYDLLGRERGTSSPETATPTAHAHVNLGVKREDIVEAVDRWMSQIGCTAPEAMTYRRDCIVGDVQDIVNAATAFTADVVADGRAETLSELGALRIEAERLLDWWEALGRGCTSCCQCACCSKVYEIVNRVIDGERLPTSNRERASK